MPAQRLELWTWRLRAACSTSWAIQAYASDRIRTCDIRVKSPLPYRLATDAYYFGFRLFRFRLTIFFFIFSPYCFYILELRALKWTVPVSVRPLQIFSLPRSPDSLTVLIDGTKSTFHFFNLLIFFLLQVLGLHKSWHGGAWTRNPPVNSRMLYRLSYTPILSRYFTGIYQVFRYFYLCGCLFRKHKNKPFALIYPAYGLKISRSPGFLITRRTA